MAYKTALSEFYAARQAQEHKIQVARNLAIQAAIEALDSDAPIDRFAGKPATRAFANIEKEEMEYVDKVLQEQEMERKASMKEGVPVHNSRIEPRASN